MPTLIGHGRLMVHGVTWPWATGPFPIVFLQLFPIFPWTTSIFSPFSHEQHFPFSHEFPLTHVDFSGFFHFFPWKNRPVMVRWWIARPLGSQLPHRDPLLRRWGWPCRRGVHSERGAGAGGTAGASAIAGGRADPLPLAAIVGGMASWFFFGDFMAIFPWFHGFMGFNGNLMGYN